MTRAPSLDSSARQVLPVAAHGNEAPFQEPLWRRKPPSTGIVGHRIGVTGAQGVGKTTFAQALGERLNIPVIDEMARTVFKLGFPLGPQTTMLSQVAMWLAQFDVERRLEAYVADRMTFDVVTHSALLAERTGDPHDAMMANLLANATACILASHYELIFYLPVEFGLVGDGVRSDSSVFQQALDAKTQELLHRFGAPFHELRGTLAERVAAAERIIELRRQPKSTVG